jgi:hypothetical protein
MSVLQRGAWVHYLPNIATILVYPATQSPIASNVYKPLPIEKRLLLKRIISH